MFGICMKKLSKMSTNKPMFGPAVLQISCGIVIPREYC